MASKSEVFRHITTGNVLDDLKVSSKMLATFRLKAAVHADILEAAAKYSSAELQQLLHESQPRISDLMRGKITKFSLETLMSYGLALGMDLAVTTNGHTHQLRAVAAG